MPEKVRLEERGPLAVIRISRPQVRNALDLETWRGLATLLREACRPGGPGHVVAIAGEGGFFSAGDDIRAMLALESPGRASEFFESLAGAFGALLSCGKPTMAVLEGPAAGGGAELVLAVDYSIAAEGAWLAYPEAFLALIPPALATLGFILLGRRAWRIALTGEVLTAEKARELGIIDEVVPHEKLWSRAVEVAESLSQIPHGIPAVIRKASLRIVGEAFKGAASDLEKLVLEAEAKRRMEDFTRGKRWVRKPGS